MKMKKMFSAMLVTAALAATSIVPSTTVFADATKVVTLGADLSDAQKSTMMKYFKAKKDEVQILFVTNADEKRLLSNYVSPAQIGSRTVSCAYVKPTSSGGIKVRTANLNYVTCNMIATTLSTSGVTNCEVVAACPFEVSGTGALTGIMMAYEHATGKPLDEQKKDIATHEMVVTKELAESIENNDDAINIVNTGKMEVIGNNIQNAEQIQNVVVNIAQENNVTIDPVILEQIVDVLQDIANQDYDYDEMKETLEKVEGNLSGDENMQPVDEPLEGEADVDIDIEDEDSIINNVNVNILIQNGGPVLETSSEDPELEMSTGADITPEDEDDLFDDSEWDLSSDGWEDIVLDGTDNDIWNNPEEEIGGEVLDGTDNDVWFNPEEELGGEIIEDMPGEDEIPFDDGMDTEAEDAINLNDLTDEQKEMFEHLENFCKGEFFGDAAALRDEMGDDAFPAANLNTEIAEKVTKDIQKMFFDVLKDGVDDYWVNPDDKYETPELDVLYLNLKDLFAIEGIMEPDQYMADVDAFDRELIFDDVMKFFEKLYGEEPVEAFDWSAATEMADNLDAVDDGMVEYDEITDDDLEVLD